MRPVPPIRVTGLGARNIVSGANRDVSLYDAQGRSIASNSFEQKGTIGFQIAAAGPVRVTAGAIYTVVLHSWDGESVPVVSSPTFVAPFASGSVEVLGAVIGTGSTVMPTAAATQAPVLEVVFAADP